MNTFALENDEVGHLAEYSFMLTKQHIRARTKTVTRQLGLGWRNLVLGDVLSGVEKGMGLKVGEKVVRLFRIYVTNISWTQTGAELNSSFYFN